MPWEPLPASEDPYRDLVGKVVVTLSGHRYRVTESWGGIIGYLRPNITGRRILSGGKLGSPTQVLLWRPEAEPPSAAAG